VQNRQAAEQKRPAISPAFYAKSSLCGRHIRTIPTRPHAARVDGDAVVSGPETDLMWQNDYFADKNPASRSARSADLPKWTSSPSQRIPIPDHPPEDRKSVV
jgi:hypothetical protein